MRKIEHISRAVLSRGAGPAPHTDSYKRGITSAPSQGGGVRPPYPAPPGYRWQYLTENGARLAENGQPLITLERVS